MKNILITGSFSVGKSTTLEEIEKKIPQKERIITKDLARHYLERNRLNSNSMTDKQREQLQLTVCSGYMGSIIEAAHAQMMAVMDGSLIEAYAYSQGVLKPNTLQALSKKLEDYKNHSIAYVLPPTIHLEDDGLRHNNKEFRVEIHKRIMQAIQEYDIPYQLITSQGVEERADEILYLHNQQ